METPTENNTSLIEKEIERKESFIGNVSVRAIVALIFTIAMCILEGYKFWMVANDPNGGEIKFTPEFLAMAGLAVGVFLGQRSSQKP